MLEGRRAISSAQGMIVVLSCVSEGRRAVSSLSGDESVIYWDFFSLSDVTCLFQMQREWGCWFVGVGLVPVGLGT